MGSNTCARAHAHKQACCAQTVAAEVADLHPARVADRQAVPTAFIYSPQPAHHSFDADEQETCKADEGIMIVKLGLGQKIDLMCVAKLGVGKVRAVGCAVCWLCGARVVRARVFLAPYLTAACDRALPPSRRSTPSSTPPALSQCAMSRSSA